MKQNTECCNNTAVCFTHALSKLTHICFFLLNIYLKISILLFRNIADVQSAFFLSEMHVGTFLDNSASPVFYSERVFFLYVQSHTCTLTDTQETPVLCELRTTETAWHINTLHQNVQFSAEPETFVDTFSYFMFEK